MGLKLFAFSGIHSAVGLPLSRQVRVGKSSVLACSLSCLSLLASADPSRADQDAALPLNAPQASIRATLKNPVVDEIAKQQHESFGSVMTDQSLLLNANPGATPTHANAFSSKLLQLGAELRYGKHNVVSGDGERGVGLIRSVANSKGRERDETLSALKTLSDKQVPEALTFVGFAAEHGAFGANLDMTRALQFYRAAAASGYQPAIYNLALASAYGRGEPRDFSLAASLLEQAAALGADSSGRVCGMGAFVNFRRGSKTNALQFARGCGSPLAALPVERAEITPPTPQRLENLRKAVATGTDDAYQVLEQATYRNAIDDRQSTYCKYVLVNRYRVAGRVGAVHEDAQKCLDTVATRAGRSNVDVRARDQALAGITSFVPAELAALDRLRKSNHFHYGASVPYLPFSQQETDLFESVLVPPSNIARN